jgi:hypothetical protein
VTPEETFQQMSKEEIMETLTAQYIQSHSSPPFVGRFDAQEAKFKSVAED